MLNNKTYWFIAIISAITAAIVFPAGSYFRLGFRGGIFFREMTFGFVFTMSVWWYNLVGFSWFQQRFGQQLSHETSRMIRILSTFVFSYAIVWGDEKVQFLHVDLDLEGYKLPEIANEFRAMLTAGIILLVVFLLDTAKKYYQTSVQVEQLKLANSVAQFEVLKQQINPHFLFNSLNILKTMIENNAPTSTEFVQRLSEFYRNTLLTNQRAHITLEQELSMLEHYIFMLKARFEDKLEIKMNISKEQLSCPIPPFTLQLLIENCIKHNVISAGKPLRINLFSDGQYLIVQNKIQLKRTIEAGNHTGLSNISQRFEIITGRSIDIKRSDTYFIVGLPLLANV